MSKEKLIALSKEHGKKSTWLKGALDRRQNRKWLIYSSEIARRILAKIEDSDNLSQAELARILKVSDQQVSKIVKGHENMTLETIGKLSNALGVELITFPAYKYSYSTAQKIATVRESLPLQRFIVKGRVNFPQLVSSHVVVKTARHWGGGESTTSVVKESENTTREHPYKAA